MLESHKNASISWHYANYASILLSYTPELNFLPNSL